MSEILCKMLYERFPPIGPHNVNRVLIYTGFATEAWTPNSKGQTHIERIHLDLIDRIFLDVKEALVQPEEIKRLADKIFDIPFDFNLTDDGYTIYFQQHGIDDYSQKYSHHFIAVKEQLKKPQIMISTGNRGAIVLNNMQREKYFQFVTELYDLFFKRARLNKSK